MSNPVGSDAKALMYFEANKKSVGAAYLLWIFLGGIGGHRFYSGRAGSGFIMLLSVVFGLLTLATGVGTILIVIVGLWAVIDGLRIPGWIRDYNTKLVSKLIPAQSAPLKASQPPPLSMEQSDHHQQPNAAASAKAVNAHRLKFLQAVAVVTAALIIGGTLGRPASVGVGSNHQVQSTTTYLAVGQQWKDKGVWVSPEYSDRTTSLAAIEPNPKAMAGSNNSWGAEVTPSPPTSSSRMESLATSSTALAFGQEIIVPSDMKARYYAESHSTTKTGRVRIVSKRIGPSGTSYTHRECDCDQSTYRTLGDGDTLDAMRASVPEQKMVKLVHDGAGFGSVSFHVCDHACKSKGSLVNRSKAKKSGPISAHDIEILLEAATPAPATALQQ